MKTLDEVMNALKNCGRHPKSCVGCPYESVSYVTKIGNTCIDVMHYDALYYMQDRIDECQQANPPLTWDELKGMEGKPVWVEPANEWILISFAGENRIFFIEKTCNEYSFPKEEYPERWQAYRKER